MAGTDQETIHKNKMLALDAVWNACKEGSDSSKHLIDFHKYQLAEIAACQCEDVHYVKIAAWGAGKGACKTCLDADGTILKLADELNKQTLPHPLCQCSGYWPDQTGVCLCRYEVVFDDELNQEKKE